MLKYLASTLALVVQISAAGLIYPATMEIVEIDRAADVVTVETATGFLYQFDGAEDYTRGDLVSLLMWSNGTQVITDDVIITARYSGWTMGEGGGAK